ncbi:MAG: cysteine synthase family protein [Saprospiraceae bacterium]|nr:cysteine synthase family protein [Saprospiraceae bacterium]MBP7679860.1 cysteine synthase family protein [Saprospiraceae bacterium]
MSVTHYQPDTIQHIQSAALKVATLIGKTPLYPIRHIYTKKGVSILAKLEWQQLGGSIKSRPAFNIIINAIEQGQLPVGKQLLDATSGNTGIAYATIGAALGIPVTLCLPENASEERKNILQSLGVNIIYTSRFDGTDGAQLKAKELFAAQPDRYFYADQYANDANWRAHYETTANEIWNQTAGQITHFVAGLGTTGTFVGTSRKLKLLNRNIQTIALQPDNPMHGLEGWKHLETAIVPKIYDAAVADQFIEIDTLESYDLIKQVAQKEGLLLSPSAAANLAGAIKVAEQIERGIIVTVFADNSDKYSEVLKYIFN